MAIRLGFFASHTGSNMQAVIDACRSAILDAEPCLVISNNSESEALARARRAGIPWVHLSSASCPNPDLLDRNILLALLEYRVQLVILAGYMRKLGPQTLTAYRGRVINIHPALLPKYGGPGMYGERVHAAVLAAGEPETGITIHLVDQDYDHGKILAQCKLPVLAGDTVGTLAARVLEKEHTFLVDTLKKIIRGEILLLSRVVD